ncbi:GGDEF domain-containing protein [Actinoplanes couchii]|uniref:GGDEF domain-containing protein n=1 Tax=Actinoplanes couchii TaxID=403638 RepID=A0ABQ3XHL5_9ACTN|nr:GGDEF domain-containing protein [Actinoplanes couchii]MDR6317605.1 diguanylate cyclase (GGDEF)-like protein [Actinoplanes couchii]GID57989.1 hypothetical protein Aco03nite_063930 [Actinoplanes couchii]
MALISLDHRPVFRARWPVVAGAALVLIHLGCALAGAPPVVTATVFVAGTGSAALAICLGIRRYRPATRLPWALIAAGAALNAAGDFLVSLYPLLFGPLPDMQWVNVPYLLRFPPLAAGIVILVRSRTPGRSLPAIIDGTVLAVAVSLVSWVFVIAPVRDSMAGTAVEPLVVAESMAYPAGDLLLIVLGLRLMLGGGPYLPALRLFGAYLALFCGADTWYTIRLLDGQIDYEWGLQSAWIIAAVLLGLAGLHPSMRLLGDRGGAAGHSVSMGRLALLAGAAMLAPATMVVQHLTGGEPHVLVVAGCCAVLFLLVVARLAGLVREQRRVAITDALTGLYTRGYLTEVLRAECARAHRGGEPLTMILLDVDHFKRVNDSYGHTAGDRVLAEVASRLRASVRAGDVVARYGGEEFAVLLPRTGSGDAARTAERLRLEIMRHGVVIGPTDVITVTVSLGLATVPTQAGTPDELVDLADELLYQSKRSGRNRLTVLPG